LDLSYVAVEAAFENISNTFDHDVIVFLKPFDFSFGTKNVIIVGAVAPGALAPFVVDSCITDLIKTPHRSQRGVAFACALGAGHVNL
jgi:hypothetical protein